MSVALVTIQQIPFRKRYKGAGADTAERFCNTPI